MKPSSAGIYILVISVPINTSVCFQPLLLVKGRVMQSSQTGEGMRQKRKAGKPCIKCAYGRGETAHRGTAFGSVSRAGPGAPSSGASSCFPGLTAVLFPGDPEQKRAVRTPPHLPHL